MLFVALGRILKIRAIFLTLARAGTRVNPVADQERLLTNEVRGVEAPRYHGPAMTPWLMDLHVDPKDRNSLQDLCPKTLEASEDDHLPSNWGCTMVATSHDSCLACHLSLDVIGHQLSR